MRLVLASALLCTATVQSSELPGSLSFVDLADPVAGRFVDPYRDMGLEMLEELRAVVRLDERLAEGGLAPEVRQRLSARRDLSRQTLVSNGFNVDELLAQRWVVAEQRRQAQTATNPVFDGAEVTLTGFLIPAGVDTDGLGSGYLVPQVGTCSHMTVPAPNELVRLRYDASMRPHSMYSPVSVSGTLRTDFSDETIELLDGEVE